ncbi:hypothetical protein P175DRAFT_0209308 [Aspergillus ochraceoroseus IBT 24754]|uniref:VOC domain-containing protein n=1 Tax=Aspergillus ochraceoroseus IBT 24754 TaxID=1392256 RepID=A0A2T5M0C4_9EURO|nr:uncharacterized protein P175DRAFT_0209308 [Aspergillus ochraceoroseus IBT 24754]PTU21978.1 hypothetical protein P175DRAFT_0209308 [Aspergillus ochraceoroseus IBT 24754]
MPLSHLTLTVSNLPTSTSFFLSCLQPLGYKFIGRHDDYIGFGQNSDEPADFWITEQKPGFPAGAAHVAFPAPSKDAVNSFFICALKAGGKIHGEPKVRDSQSGYFSAAIMDMDGNSIEAVYRPSPSSGSSSVSSVARSVVSKPALALLENGSVVSKATSRASTIRTESIAPPRSEARSEARSYASKAVTAIDRGAPSERGTVVSTREIQPAPSPTYVVHHTTSHTTQQSDDGKTAKTIVGTLIGAAAGAALAYAMTKSDADTKETTPSTPGWSAQDFRQLISPSQAPSQIQQSFQQIQQQLQGAQGYPALEPPPARSTCSQADSRPHIPRSVSSKNPHASTIYEGTEFIPRGAGGSVYYDENGRRASDGSIYSPSELPLRAIEYPPGIDSQGYPADVSTLISSFREKSRISDKGGSVYSSASTLKPSKVGANNSYYHPDQQSAINSYHSTSKSHAGHSTASSTRSARQVPLPEGSVASFASYRSGAKSAALYDDAFEIQSHVTPDDSISQVGDPAASSRRSSYSHRSHASHTSHTSRRSSKFDEPVRPSDSVSQVSSHASKMSQRTVKANGSIAGGASQAGSRMSSASASRRGSQVA